MTELKTSGGVIEKEVVGGITCSRYKGEFESGMLKGRARTGAWYTMVSGNPAVIEGEGMTPVLAIKNSIERTQDRISWMRRGLTSLEEAVTILATTDG